MIRRNLSKPLVLCCLLVCWCSNTGVAAQRPPDLSPMEAFGEGNWYEPHASATSMISLVKDAEHVRWFPNAVAFALITMHGAWFFECLGKVCCLCCKWIGCCFRPKRKLILPARLVGRQRLPKHRRRETTPASFSWSRMNHTVRIACPTSHAERCPQFAGPRRRGLNSVCRGGAGGAGGAKATDRKRTERDLLHGLQSLLAQFATDTEVEPPPSKRPKVGVTDEPDEQGLLQALTRLVERARVEPRGLLQRLSALVNSAAAGKPLQPHKRKPKTRKQMDGGEVMHTKDGKGKAGPRTGDGKGKGHPRAGDFKEPPGPGKAAGKGNPQSGKAGKNPAASKGGKSQIGADGQTLTMAQVVAKNKPTGAVKGGARALAKPTEPACPVLHKDAFPDGAVLNVAQAKGCLTIGKAPEGWVLQCNAQTALDLRRLAKLHGLSDAKIALLLGPEDAKTVCNAESDLQSQSMCLPTWENNKPNVCRFHVLPLSQALPDLPVQKVIKTSVGVEDVPLMTFRVIVAKDVCSKDTWEGYRRNPNAQVRKAFEDGILHSVYGFKELSLTGRHGDTPELIIQGYLRCKKVYVSRLANHLGADGMFIERLASDTSCPKQNVWWLAKGDTEPMREYHARAVAEARQCSATLAHRRGGGSSLGLRLPKSQRPSPQKRAWTLHNAPKHWAEPEVRKCLEETGASEIEILRPPGRQRNWLCKAIIPDETDVGVVAIEAGNRSLLLQRVQHHTKRHAEVVKIIKGNGSLHDDTGALAKPETKDVNVPGAEKPEDASRERSRSPKKSRDEAQDQVPHADRFEVQECGGGGDCGYLCLAARMGFEKGESWQDMVEALPTRAKTIRFDLFKHMTSSKHEADYKEWFVPQQDGDENHEAGSVPQTWTEYTETCLRPGRWIDGIGLKAACRRYGLNLIVVPCTKSAKDRPMMFGTPKSGRPPIVLLLSQGHYRLARLRDGRQWPREWLNAEPAEVASQIFRASAETPLRTPCTPCRKRPMEAQRNWRPESTPASSWRPAATPATSWRPAATPESRGMPHSVRASSVSKQKGRPKDSAGTLAKSFQTDVNGLMSWKCPECSEVMCGVTYNALAMACEDPAP